jgi:FlaA1/EpsC-like NDP-sugar epimerase
MSVARAARPYRWLISLLFHALIVTIGYWLAFLLRFEFPIETEDGLRYLITLPIILALRLSAFAWFHLYERLWRYVSMKDILAILWSVTFSSLAAIPIIVGLIDRHFPWPIFPLDWGICLLFVGGVRLAFRALHESVNYSTERAGRRALIIGAGDAGELLIREIGRNASLNYQVVGFVDDDSSKQKRRIHGVEVVGRVDQLPALSRKYDAQELLIAIPSATGTAMRRIIGACRASMLEFKTLPSLLELSEGPFTLSKVRRVNIEDLLRREPVRIDHAEIEQFIFAKRVIVTGAGGSIGSDLCRQLARFRPENLILLDRAENSLFFAEMELREKYPDLVFRPVIGDVTDEGRINSIFREHKPHIVFHAAAHKHVPMMELNKSEAIKNNVRGTMVVAEASWRAGLESFVMISTDKAVRPTSIMGVTKRLAEMYVQSLGARIETRFMTVRFGNVLGSEGSVIQVFQRQIEMGGPVRITHPSMKRYFMTIPEAAQLVLQAATQGKGGEIFVLDMGDPVSIVELAKDLIALSGLDPEKDIEIKFTGVRPGEKLFEELLGPETRVLPTSHPKVMIAQTKVADYDCLNRELIELIALADNGDEQATLAKVAVLVPDYRPGSALSQLIPANEMG